MEESLKKNIYASTTMALGAVLTMAVPSVALESEDLLSLSLEELVQIKVISSTLTEESLKKVPASITVFTRAQIQQLGINTLEELMNHVPGYQSYHSDLGSANYSSRSRRLSNSTCEVLVLLDGQRLEHDVFCGISPTDSDFPLYNVDRVEFLRGPGSSIYGTNALLGVVNIITQKNLNNVGISLGNYQQKRAAVNVSHQFDNGLQTSISAQSDNADSGQSRLFDPLTQNFSDGHQQHNERQSIYWRANWGEWSLQARHVNKLIEDGYSIGNISDNESGTDSYSNFIAMHYEHSFNEQWKLDSRIYNTPYRVKSRGRVDVAPIISKLTFTGKESGIENHLSWQEDNDNILLGADFSRFSISKADIQNELPNGILETAEILTDEDRDVKAIYGQWQHSQNEHISYIAGVRHDDYSDIKSHISPRVGLIYQCTENNTVKLLYGEAFRAPSRLELHVQNNPLQAGNPNLDPEIAKTTELIWMHTNQTHYLSISLFDTVIENPVVLSNTPALRPYINSDQEHMNGMEVELKWAINDNWQVDSAISQIFNSPIAINHDAEALLSASLIYTSYKMSFSLSGNYHGESRDADNSTLGYHSLGGVTLFDAHAQYQLTSTLNLYATIRNLTDKQYNQPAFQNSLNIYGVPATGRTLEAGLRLAF